MTIRRPAANNRIIIDLDGPDGNAYFLLGYVTRLCNDLGYTDEQRQNIIKDMTSSDYVHLVQVFDSHFGQFVTLTTTQEDLLN